MTSKQFLIKRNGYTEHSAYCIHSHACINGFVIRSSFVYTFTWRRKRRRWKVKLFLLYFRYTLKETRAVTRLIFIGVMLKIQNKFISVENLITYKIALSIHVIKTKYNERYIIDGFENPLIRRRTKLKFKAMWAISFWGIQFKYFYFHDSIKSLRKCFNWIDIKSNLQCNLLNETYL